VPSSDRAADDDRGDRTDAMKALVTGGAGFIGSNLVQALIEDGDSVVVLDDLSTGFRANLADAADVIIGDVRIENDVDRAARGVDVIFHLAASVGNGRSIEDPVRDSEVNVIGTVRVLEAARRFGVGKIVFSSSAAIFGELKQLPIREDHPAEPDTPYGASKLAAEKLCLAFAKLYAIDAVCLRYFNVYGERQRHDAYGNVIPIFVHRMLQGQPLVVYGDGLQTRDFVHVRDVVQANVRSARTPRVAGAYNIGSGRSVTINYLADLVGALGPRRSDVEHAAPRKGDVRDSRADTAAARAAFGYTPQVELEEGLRAYAAWVEADRAEKPARSR
jgi:UDP-glucose 4-epimerase